MSAVRGVVARCVFGFVLALVVGFGLVWIFGGDPVAERAGGDADVLAADEAARAPVGERTVVEGFVFIDEVTGPLLCSARDNTDPPVCTGTAVALDGLDTTRLDLIINDEPARAYDAWSRGSVRLLGVTGKGTFFVADIVG